MPDIDPRQVRYNGGEYGTGPDGGTYNRQGNETWESKYNRNVKETKQRYAAAREQYEAEEKRKSPRQYSQQRSYNSSPSFSFDGLFSGIGGFLVGWLGLFIIAAVLVAIAVLVGFVQYHAKGVMGFFGTVFSVIRKIVTMPFTAWPTLFSNRSFIGTLETVFAVGVIIFTIRCFRDGLYIWILPPYLPAFLGVVTGDHSQFQWRSWTDCFHLQRLLPLSAGHDHPLHHWQDK